MLLCCNLLLVCCIRSPALYASDCVIDSALNCCLFSSCSTRGLIQFHGPSPLPQPPSICTRRFTCMCGVLCAVLHIATPGRSELNPNMTCSRQQRQHDVTTLLLSCYPYNKMCMSLQSTTLLQYRGTDGSASKEYASMPPVTLNTLQNPLFCTKNCATCMERTPWWHSTIVSLVGSSCCSMSVAHSAKRDVGSKRKNGNEDMAACVHGSR